MNESPVPHPADALLTAAPQARVSDHGMHGAISGAPITTAKHDAAGSPLATECREFLAYAARRLEKCPYGERKPTCAKCPIHCYKRAQREHAREIMRYAGPKMTYRHPWLALMHLVDKVRKVEHPMAARRRKAAQGGKPDDRSPDNG
jgi:hypothetical protein